MLLIMMMYNTMPTFILFDDKRRDHLLPLTFTRPVAELRMGILTIAQKWELMLNAKASHLTQRYLSGKYPPRLGEINCLINGGVCPDAMLIKRIMNLKLGEALVQGDVLIAALVGDRLPTKLESTAFVVREHPEVLLQVQHLWDLFVHNGTAIERDFELLTQGRSSQPIAPSNHAVRPERIFIEEGAKVECAVLNASSGPIYIGRDAEVMEGSLVRGGLCLGEHSVLKMGAKIYGPTTIGPHCKVGGEVSSSVLMGYTNKAHDGFLGNSVLGEWCNLGADTNSSNLKNNYAEVKLWSYALRRFEKTGLQFCGLIMADHSKCGINTMFNTGTVVGVAANIFGSGFPRNFIPSFAWGGAAGLEVHALSMALGTAAQAMARRGLELSANDREILGHIFSLETPEKLYSEAPSA